MSPPPRYTTSPPYSQQRHLLSQQRDPVQHDDDGLPMLPVPTSYGDDNSFDSATESPFAPPFSPPRAPTSPAPQRSSRFGSPASAAARARAAPVSPPRALAFSQPSATGDNEFSFARAAPLALASPADQRSAMGLPPLSTSTSSGPVRAGSAPASPAPQHSPPRAAPAPFAATGPYVSLRASALAIGAVVAPVADAVGASAVDSGATAAFARACARAAAQGGRATLLLLYRDGSSSTRPTLRAQRKRYRGWVRDALAAAAAAATTGHSESGHSGRGGSAVARMMTPRRGPASPAPRGGQGGLGSAPQSPGPTALVDAASLAATLAAAARALASGAPPPRPFGTTRCAVSTASLRAACVRAALAGAAESAAAAATDAAVGLLAAPALARPWSAADEV